MLLVPLLGLSQPTEKACFSVKGGFYEESPLLEIFPFYQQHHIRFTINGNRPTAESRLYTEPLLLDESFFSTSDIYTIPISPDNLVYVPDSVRHCIVIRAAVFDENDSCISDVSTNSYFIRSLGGDTHDLPAVSLCLDSLDLFDYEHGIFVPGVFFDSLNTNMGHTHWFLQKRGEYIEPVLTDFLKPWPINEDTCTRIEVFPNPTNGPITLRLEADHAETFPCSVYDVIGHLVYAQTLSCDVGSNTYSVPLPQTPGLYLVKINDMITKIVRQ